ncbi:STAS domain-containing protein [Mycolicibacterium sp.]|uniref:STAS domain-containing protein n=1 Tax=Mycolicibacterium sp. TaxID=2320850 RepID=UPI003D0B19A3
MPTALTVDTVRHERDDLRLTVAGEIDLSNIEAFRQAVGAAVAEAADLGADLTIDMAGVEYVDSAAINVLSAQAERIGRLVIHPLLMTTLTISGLTELVAVEAAPVDAGR